MSLLNNALLKCNGQASGLITCYSGSQHRSIRSDTIRGVEGEILTNRLKIFSTYRQLLIVQHWDHEYDKYDFVQLHILTKILISLGAPEELDVKPQVIARCMHGIQIACDSCDSAAWFSRSRVACLQSVYAP